LQELIRNEYILFGHGNNTYNVTVKRVHSKNGSKSNKISLTFLKATDKLYSLPTMKRLLYDRNGIKAALYTAARKSSHKKCLIGQRKTALNASQDMANHDKKHFF